MRISSLRLSGFRNHSERTIEPSPGLTVFVGPNASGKTNALEGIALAANGISFRRPRWEEVVTWGSSDAVISLEAGDDTTHVRIDLHVTREGHKELKINGVKKRRLADLSGLLPVVSFIPDDLDLVKGAAERRRMSADELGGQLSKSYRAIGRDYSRVIRHRNMLLRQWRPSESELAPWTEQAITLGAKLVVHRRRLLRRVIDHAGPVYSRLSGGETLGLEYKDRCGIGLTDVHTEVSEQQAIASLESTFLRRREEEKARQTTLVGPHRDDISFVIDGREARIYASQGQQRTIALAWKLAEVNVIQEVLNTEPILLLDDVMSELDAARRRALTDLVREHIQTFITTTNTGYFDPALLQDAVVVQIGSEGDGSPSSD
ncbi:MAG: DNA replication/repair protein RecF [Actinomycetia bacterium]|nr:DNA replication/repair protein RecF [Actinomycetes bacterium]